ncbi:hypothetical protein [Pseudarthrobacter sp. lyk4-40-TYG-27]|uniref:hypothetical protein n=1 Tax=Pseudarthrobacter sp. lyk4-40-TYG-27 TaxID=3040305 RepID=UPI0025573A38|nr:hypothetical protein [Pseudarthrobacter sp. lyk4-40-TYG-27]
MSKPVKTRESYKTKETKMFQAFRLSRLIKGIGTIVSLMALIATGGAIAAVPAEAAAFTYSVYAPNKVNSTTAEGWANLSRDCSGTYGCWSYMKIEKREWWGWSYRGGGWVNNNGWNSIRGELTAGCGDYRTTVDSYNDVAGGYGSGANIGPVGASSNGTRIYRYKTTWSSGTNRLCR